MKSHPSFPVLAVFLALLFLGSCNYEKIEPNDQACFTYKPVACTGAGLKLRFTADCVLDNPTKYVWKFEDDPDEVEGSTVEHVFPQEKTYQVTLTVTLPSGGTNSVTVPVEVNISNVLPKDAQDSRAEHQAAQAVALTNDGGYIVCGVNEDVPGNPSKTTLFLTKYNADLAPTAHQTYAYKNSTFTTGYGVVANPDGTFTVCGTTLVNGKKQIYVATMTNDLSPTPVLENHVNINDQASAQDGFYISRTPSGSYFIAGQDYAGFGTGIVVKVPSDLNFTGTPFLMNGPTAHQVKALGENSFVVGGSRYLPTDNTYTEFFPTMFVGKWQDNSANWMLNAGQMFNPDRKIQEGFAVAPLSDGTFAACGVSKVDNNVNKRIYIIHLDAGGQMLNEWNLPEGIIGSDIVEASDGGGVIVACTRTDGDQYNTKNDNPLLIKFNLATGQIVWQKQLGVPAVQDDAYCLIPTIDCGYLAVGRSSNNAPGGGNDNLLIKTNFQGK